MKISVCIVSDGLTGGSGTAKGKDNFCMYRSHPTTQAALAQYYGGEFESSCGYFSGYCNPDGVAVQIDILRSHWPSLRPDVALRYAREVYPTFQLPGWVEGPFAIIRPGYFSDSYREELKVVLKALSKSRGLLNHCNGCPSSIHLRQTVRTIEKLRLVAAEQAGSDILVVPGQLGIRHRGRSMPRVRKVLGETVLEYGMSAKDAAVILLTQRIRLGHTKDLGIYCAGDECRFRASGSFSCSPCFRFGGSWGFWRQYCEKLEFDFADGCAETHFGAASFFFPQGVSDRYRA